jgi:hypothetical protein
VRVKVPVSLHHRDDERKANHDAETLDRLMRELAIASPGLERFCRELEASPRTFALSVSNVPGPGGPLTVVGAPVEALYSLAEIGERHALRIAVVSASGNLRFGFCSDPAIVHDLDRLARGVEAEGRGADRCRQVGRGRHTPNGSARFRSSWSQGRGGSSPSARIFRLGLGADELVQQRDARPVRHRDVPGV